MAYNPLSSSRLPADDPFFEVKFPQTYADQRNLGLIASPNARGVLQAPTNQQRPNLAKSPSPGGEICSSQPKSVKHLTCWYWANKGCRLPDHVCLYSHIDTGRLADPPVQVQRGREFSSIILHQSSGLFSQNSLWKARNRANTKSGPAVAGKNATNPQPVYKDWKGHQRAHPAVVDPQIQNQLKHIYAKAAQPSTPTPLKAEQSETAKMVKGEWFGSDEPAVNFNRPHPDDHLFLPPADSYRNMSIGVGASGQPSPRPMGGNFVPPIRATQDFGGSTHYGIGGDYGGTGGNYAGMGGNYRGMGDNPANYGPGPHHSGRNSLDNPNTSAPSGPLAGQSGGPIQEMQKQMQVKDKVITELAGLVEMLEINCGISIDDQVDTFQKFMTIARSMEDEAREAGNAASTGNGKGNYAYQSASTRG